MSKVLVEHETIKAIATKIKLKTANTAKMKVSEMPDRIGVLHGYKSSAKELPSDPSSYAISVFEIADFGVTISAAAEVE